LPGKKKKINKKRSRLLMFFVVIFALILVLIPALVGLFMYFNYPVYPGEINALIELDGIRLVNENSYHLEIRRGESAQSVGRRLEKAGLIRNRYFWQLLCRFESEHIKAGTYLLEIPASQIAIHRLLVSGRQILHRVTIPEGSTLKRTAALLEEAGICFAEDFLQAARDPAIINQFNIPNSTMEGYLFPETYLFPGEYSATRVVTTMADTFFSRLKQIEPAVFDMNPQELNRRVIIASIVEREYRVPQEAPLMAGVFYNRLRIGMALQSCATVEYVITEILGRPHPRVLFYRDLEIRSPYNTYLYPGLPPGPISAPGAVALHAAFFPEESSFLYFRLIEPQTGRHYFSRTLDEHIRAGQLLLKNR
jgi:UPF0755 protein